MSRIITLLLVCVLVTGVSVFAIGQQTQAENKTQSEKPKSKASTPAKKTTVKEEQPEDSMDAVPRQGLAMLKAKDTKSTAADHN
jgi:hypothetical protein